MISHYGGVARPERDRQWEPRLEYLRLDSGAFFSGYGSVFFQVNLNRSGAALTGQLSSHGSGVVFFQVKRFFQVNLKKVSHISPPPSLGSARAGLS